ncbi:phosphatidylinositol 3-kinase [Dichotomocladium elegans]|nr:phosphatidylinositol 3-kinase [Dichotomocladium elegans]
MDFSYCLTKDIELPVAIRIASLEGSRDRKQWINDVQFYNEEDHTDYYVTVQLFGDNKPLTLPVRTSYKAFRSHCSWNEWLTLPIKYCELPPSSQCAITVWDTKGPRQAVPVGGTTLRLFGKYFTLRKGKHKLHLWPGQEADGRDDTKTPSDVKIDDDMEKLEKLVKRYHCGDIQQVEWLDNMAFRYIEKVHTKAAQKSMGMALYIDLPKFDFPVVFGEMEYTLPDPNDSLNTTQHTATNQVTTMNQSGYSDSTNQGRVSIVHPTNAPQSYSLILDLDTIRGDNPVEAKHRRLVRSHRNGPLDRDLKPNPKIRDHLNTLTTEAKDLVWKFRFYLTRDKRALTKFLKCVVWTDPTEVRQAVDLLPLWVDIDVDDALELLGKEFSNRAVRSYAVNQLRKADDDDLLLYLLQLVQALKFEHLVEKGTRSYDSSLLQFLLDRATQNPILGNYFHWYLMVECGDKIVGKMFAKISYLFFTAMLEKAPNGHHRRNVLRQQGELILTLSAISQEIRAMKDVRAKKVEKLRAILSDPKGPLANLPELPLPLDPTVRVRGIIPEKSGIFNSNLQPLRLTFSCDDGSEYPIIFKTGDDLRQDQLVIQIITLMDKLLQKENLDLRLTPYKVLATDSEGGLMQFIPSMSLAAVLNEHQNNVIDFFKKHNPDPGPDGIYGVDAQVMETYIRSCAGYCVITYLLGVGDRHLDNLLLSPEGHLFHVDFGFILGRDPKPFPPPMKLCKEMIEAMGGANSRHYNKFRQYCYTAFTTLRRNANLILNLFALMVDANIPDIKIEPDKAVNKVQEKFRLDLSEEAAIAYFQSLISESVNALFPQIMETVHKWAQYWRS